MIYRGFIYLQVRSRCSDHTLMVPEKLEKGLFVSFCNMTLELCRHTASHLHETIHQLKQHKEQKYAVTATTATRQTIATPKKINCKFHQIFVDILNMPNSFVRDIFL